MLQWCRTTISRLDGYIRLPSGAVRHHAYATILKQRPKESASIYILPASMQEWQPSSKAPVTRTFRRVSSKERHMPTHNTTFDSLNVYTQAPVSKTRTSLRLAHSKKDRIPDLANTPAEIPLTDQHQRSYNATLSTLKDILSLSHHSQMQHSIPMSALDSMYDTAKEAGQLESLTASQLTELLSLFGTVSLGKSSAACVYHSPLVRCVDESSDETKRWDNVTDILQVKEGLKFELNMQDRYWLLRSVLFSLKCYGQSTSVSSSGLSIRKQLARARVHYEIIARTSSEAEVHIPYFEAVLKHHRHARVAEVVHGLCSILGREAHPDQRLSDLLWDVILQYQRFMTPSLRERILQTLSCRLSKLSGHAAAFKSSVLSGRRPLDEPNDQLASASNHLAALLAGCFFPGYKPSSAITSVEEWAFGISRDACEESLPIETRWSNVMLLALYLRPRFQDVSVARMDVYDDGYLNWRTVLTLGIVDNRLHCSVQGSSVPKSNAQISLRPLWRSWRRSASQVRTVSALRMIVASFFQLAGDTADGHLIASCLNFCCERNLFVDANEHDPKSLHPTLELITSYVRAAAVCGNSWGDIFSSLTETGVKQSQVVVESILGQIIPENPHRAFQLCILAHKLGIDVSFHFLLALSKIFVSNQEWGMTLKLMTVFRFEETEIHELILSILEGFRTQRTTRVQTQFTGLLGRMVQEFCSVHAPPIRAKYTIRFFLPIAIASRQPAMAIKIVELIHKTIPSFFTVRFLLRLLRLLLQHGQFLLAIQLSRIALRTPGSPRAVDDFQRKLTLGLAAGGAYRLAQKGSQMRRSSKGTGARERLLQAIRFKFRFPNRSNSFTMSKQLGKGFDMEHSSSVQHAIALSLKAKRYSLARKLYAQVSRDLDKKTNTMLGNMILHAPMHRLDHRNGRLVRFVVRTKDFLVERHGFKPDRATLNIIMKSLLKWGRLNSSQLKALFDQLARQGFISPKRWNRQGDTPFGTSPSPSAQPFSLSSLSPDVSFHRHTRPLLKMFIKAFHLRGDRRAAQTVIGIMKEEAEFAKEEWEKRERARRLGLVKKASKQATQRPSTAAGSRGR